MFEADRAYLVVIFVLSMALSLSVAGDIDLGLNKVVNQNSENLSNDDVAQSSSDEVSVVKCEEDRACSETRIENTSKSCERFSSELSQLECEMAPQRYSNFSGDISLITGKTNYVSGELSDSNYETKYYSGISSATDIEPVENGFFVANDFTKLELRDENAEMVAGPYEVNEYIDTSDAMENSQIGTVKGFAVDPDFEENSYIYLYYIVEEKGVGESWERWKNQSYFKRRLARFKFEPNSSQPISDKKLLVKSEGARAHSGGGVEFGPDGKLYLTVGESHNATRSQKMSIIGGKVLRLNPDGTVPEDNPFEDSHVYSLGHRNPQGIGWNPETGSMFVAEHGPVRYDEVNRVEPGENYGWGYVACNTPLRSGYPYSGPTVEKMEFEKPVRCFDDWTMAPSRLTFVDNESSPWYGDMFLAGLRGNHLRRFEMDSDTIGSEEIFYYSEKPAETGMSRRLRDVEYSEGSLWILGNPGGLVEITPS